jgi:hypothetical protein
MISRIAADLLVLAHLGFIVFVVAGGLLVLKWRWLPVLHLPAALWGALVEFQGWYCPLTPLEQRFRQAAGDEGYSGGFIEHYLLPVIYPEALTRDIQGLLGIFVVVINLTVYALVIARLWRNRSRGA